MKTIKNKNYFIFFLVVFGIAACSSTPVQFDPSLPLEQSSRILFRNIHVIEYNGIPVEHSRTFDGYANSSWRHIALPPGEIEFLVDVYRASIPGVYFGAIPVYSGRNFIFRYTFQADNNYTIIFGLVDGSWGVTIYVNPPPGNLLAQEGIFVPFLREQTGPVILQ